MTKTGVYLAMKQKRLNPVEDRRVPHFTGYELVRFAYTKKDMRGLRRRPQDYHNRVDEFVRGLREMPDYETLKEHYKSKSYRRKHEPVEPIVEENQTGDFRWEVRTIDGKSVRVQVYKGEE
jgi:hypothetical protein